MYNDRPLNFLSPRVRADILRMSSDYVLCYLFCIVSLARFNSIYQVSIWRQFWLQFWKKNVVEILVWLNLSTVDSSKSINKMTLQMHVFLSQP